MDKDEELIAKVYGEVMGLGHPLNKLSNADIAIGKGIIRAVRSQVLEMLKNMEKDADFEFVKGGLDLAYKNYERGRFDSIHNAIAKLRNIN